MGVTSYSGISAYYFRYLLRVIIETGGIDVSGVTVLDYGCGHGELSHLAKHANVIGYDIVEELSDVSDWRSVEYDYVVANEVFYSFSEEELDKLMIEFHRYRPSATLVVGISRQNILNNLGKMVLGRPNAHAGTKLSPLQELDVLCRHCDIVARRNVWWLANVYVLKFKNQAGSTQVSLGGMK